MANNLKEQNAKNEARIVEAIRANGKPNPSFKQDLDITYGELHKLCNTIGGLPSILKQMKREVGEKKFFGKLNFDFLSEFFFYFY